MGFQSSPNEPFQSPPPAGGFGANAGPTAFGPMNAGTFPTSTSSDRLAVTALVLGALSVPLGMCMFLGVPLGVAAIVVSVSARRKIQNHPDLFHGEKTAKTAFWFGVVGVVFSALYIAVNVIGAFCVRSV